MFHSGNMLQRLCDLLVRCRRRAANRHEQSKFCDAPFRNIEYLPLYFLLNLIFDFCGKGGRGLPVAAPHGDVRRQRRLSISYPWLFRALSWAASLSPLVQSPAQDVSQTSRSPTSRASHPDTRCDGDKPCHSLLSL